MSKKRKSKSAMPALLIGGAVLAYLFLKKDSSSPEVPGTPIDDNSGSQGYNYSDSEGEGVTPAGVHYTYTQTGNTFTYTSDAGKRVSYTVVPGSLDKPLNWGTQFFDPFLAVNPPIVVNQTTATQLVTSAAIADRSALLRYSSDAAFQAAINKMNDGETISSYNYVFNYLIQGKKLYQYPNSSGIFSDGGWDTTLYNQILAIKAKYNIF